MRTWITTKCRTADCEERKKGRYYLLLLFSLLAIVVCSAIGIYAFLANEVSKVDVSAPDPVGPVIVPENYQNLLVLDIAIPSFDAGRVGEDVKLHNGVAGSYPRDILLPFDPTDWYSDHDGDTSFDGNSISGDTETIISSNDDILDSGDIVKKTGLCLFESFDSSGGVGEQYIDDDRTESYTDGEAVVRTSTSSGEVHPGEIVRSGAAEMTPFTSNIRFTDGIDGNAVPAQYHNGEAIISSGDGILDSGDTVLTPGNADLSVFPVNILYSDFGDDSKYANEEAIIQDGGISGQLDVGPLDGTGTDAVLKGGMANLKPVAGQGLLLADDNNDNEYTPGELIVASADLSVDPGEVKLPGSANLRTMAGLSFADDNDNDQFDSSELIIKNTGTRDDVLEAADAIISPGSADLMAFTAGVERFIDNNQNGVYNNGECIIRDGGIVGTVEPGDIEKPGFAILLPFSGGNYLFTDNSADGVYTGDVDLTDGYQGEAIFSDASADGQIDNGELLTAGYAALKSFPANAWFADSGNPGNGSYDNGEAVIISDDDLLSDSDTIVRSGSALFTAFDPDIKWADCGFAVRNTQYDDGELIVNSPDNTLNPGEVVKPGYCDLKSLADEHVGEVYSDNDNSNTYTIGELTILSDDTILDAGDSVVTQGAACMISLQNSLTRFVDVDAEKDFDPEEAIVYDPNANRALDDGDRVVKSGTTDIKSLGDETVYIDHSGDGDFQGDTDDDVNWDDLDDTTWANDPDVINDQDEVILNDPIGANHLALDPGDSVMEPGMALLTVFHETEVYTDNDNGEYDGGASNEAIIRDNNTNLTLETTDVVIVSGVALIRDFDPPTSQRYIDANNDGSYTSGEATIIDGGVSGILDAGALDGTGTDQVVISGAASLTRFRREEKFVDADQSGTYEAGEAVVYDWYKSDTLEGEYILAGDPLFANGSLAYLTPAERENDRLTNRARDSVLLASAPGSAAMIELNDVVQHKYTDNSHSGTYDGFYVGPYEAIIWSENDQLDEGALDGTGIDHVIVAGYANLRPWTGNLKWTDDNHDNEYQGNEAIVDDGGDDDLITLIGIGAGDDRIIIPGDADLNDFSAMKYVDADESGSYDAGELVVNDLNQDDMVQNDEIGDPGPVPFLQPFVSASANYRYCDSDRGSDLDSQEAIVIDTSVLGILESTDTVVTAGYAGLISFALDPMNMFVDYNHDNICDNNEAIIYGDGDQVLEGSDQIITPGAATSFDGTSLKYAATNAGNPYTDGLLIVDDNGDDLVDGNEIIASGAALLWDFSAVADRYADSDHDDQYDYSIVDGFGEAIVVNTTGNASEVESSDTIETDGYADLQGFSETTYKYSDANRNDEFTDGELIVNDLNSDYSVDAGEIIRAGVANLKEFSADVMYMDVDGDNLYSIAEAIIHTGNTTLSDDDEVLVSGAAGLLSFEGNTYRFADADHDDAYDTGEAIVVESGWGTVDDALEDSDIVILAGEADIEQFFAKSMYLDDEGDSDAYEDGEAIVDDSNGDNLLDPGEIITGGRAALRKFTGGAKYTDGGAGANAHNAQYDVDEAIVRDGNSNGELDSGALDGTANDTVLTAGKAGFTQFDNDGLPDTPNCDDEHYVDADGNSQYDGTEDIYLDKDNNDILTMGDDALEYFVVENTGSANNSDLAAVNLWADRDDDGQFEPDADDSPVVIAMIPDASNQKMWYEGPATAPPLSASSAREFIGYTMQGEGQRFFVTIDTSSTPTDSRDIQMQIPLNGVKTLFGSSGPSDAVITNAYTQKIDSANPDTAEITSPTANAVFYGTVTLQAAASDTLQVGKVEFYIDPPGGGNTPIAVDDDGAPWEALWDSSTVEYGFHTLYARVYDRTYLRPPQTWEIDHYMDSDAVPVIVAISYTVQLADGWSLVSVPVEAFDPSLDSILSLIDGNCIAIWAYNAATLEWTRYDQDGPDFLNKLDMMNMDLGYWFEMSGPGTLDIYGTMTETAIALQMGWNLVGCNSITPVDVIDAMASINCDFEIWTIDPETGEWLNYDPTDPTSNLDEIKPGWGYWIYVSESCVWDIGL